jgi:glycine/D-amino acid oxidase-like deaminating enzyme
MKTYDWIVIGAGITGAALAYELLKGGMRVLLLEQNITVQNATRYSYGGLAFWCGTTPLTRQLCDEGIARYRFLAEELDSDIEFRELDLLLTIDADTDPNLTAASYSRFAIPPKLLSIKEACELEPLLNPEAIAGALTVKHGHICPEKTAQGYINAFTHAGGEIEYAQVLELQNSSATWEKGVVKTTKATYHSAKVVVCAGGLTRKLLQSSGISINLYFTHAEMIETLPVDVELRTLVMPANLKRFQLEAESTRNDKLWDNPGQEILPPILDPGAIQFLDGSLRLGQISRALTDPNAQVNSEDSEKALRVNIRKVLPGLSNLPGTWHHCLVSFSSDGLPLIGTIPQWDNIYVFSGFSNPLVIVPPLAQRFVNCVCGSEDKIIFQLSPQRFQTCL